MPSLSEEQLSVLMRDLNSSRISKRSQGGRQLSYLEAWDVKATLIRIFGFGGFSSDVIESEVIDVWRENPGDKKVTVSVKVTVRLHIPQLEATYTEVAASSQTGSQGFGDVADFAFKGLAVDTPIPTPDGWTTMGDLQVGDVVFDMNGIPTIVQVKSEVKNLDCYRITFNDGRQIVCDEEHYWYARNGKNAPVKVHNIVDLYNTKQAGGSVSIPLNGALNLPDAELPVDPWTLGFWLGDGDKNSGRLTVHERDLDEVLALVGAESSVSRDGRNGKVATVRVGGSAPGSRAGLTTALRSLGVLGQKMVPMEYLRGSAAQRLALLQGLMDSDGTVSNGRPVFTNTSRILAEQVAELVHSLGDRPSITTHQVTGFGKEVTAYNVTWTPSLIPFKLKRKAEKVQVRTKAGSNRVRSIEKIDSVPTQCIGVASETKSYLAGVGMVPTHNTAESDALKRAAIFLGTQFGLSLYNNGATQEVIKTIVAPEQKFWMGQRQLPAPEEVRQGIAENDVANTVSEAEQDHPQFAQQEAQKGAQPLSGTPLTPEQQEANQRVMDKLNQQVEAKSNG